VTHRLAGLAPQLSRGPAIGSPAGQQAHHYRPDPDVRRRRLLPAIPRTAPSRGHFEGGHERHEHAHHPVRRTNVLPNLIEGHLLQIFAVLVLVSTVGLGVLFYSVYPSLSAAGPPPVMTHSLTSVANTSVGKTDTLGTSTHARVDRSEAVAGATRGQSRSGTGKSDGDRAAGPRGSARKRYATNCGASSHARRCCRSPLSCQH